MRISLIGYGKMGRTVERLAREDGHDVIQILELETPRDPEAVATWASRTDVLIDFSSAGSVLDNVELALRWNLPLVEGTTGWDGQLEKVQTRVRESDGAFIYASNFSLGVQLFLALAANTARLMARFPEFAPFLWEAHHSAKKDAPSGTALTLKSKVQPFYEQSLTVASLRAGSIPGTHVLGFDSQVDTITLEHCARNRDGFARGSLIAAEWLLGKTGFFTFEEALFGDLNV